MATLQAEKTTPFVPVVAHASLSEEYLSHRFSRPARKKQEVAYEFVRDAGLLHQYCLLRQDMFINLDGSHRFTMEKDPLDDVSDILIARQGRQCVAGGRLTVCEKGKSQRLPMEGADLILQDMLPGMDLAQCNYGEFSQLAILPEFRAGEVFPEFARRFINRAISRNVKYAFNLAPMPLARNYRQAVQLFGVSWELRTDVEIADRDEYEGIPMVLSVMDLSRYIRPEKQTAKATARREDALAD